MDTKTVETRALQQPRLEDDALVRGLGRFIADVAMTGQAYAYFVRSPHAFADIRSIATEAARAAARGPYRRRHGRIDNLWHPPLARRMARASFTPARARRNNVAASRRGMAMVVRERPPPPRRHRAVAVDWSARRRSSAGRARGATQVAGAPGYRRRWLDERSASQREGSGRSLHRRAPRVAVVHQIMVASMEPRGATWYDAAAKPVALLLKARGRSDGLSQSWAYPMRDCGILRTSAARSVSRPGCQNMSRSSSPRLLGRRLHWMSGRAEAFLAIITRAYL